MSSESSSLPDKTTAETGAVAKVRQPHGGALNRGGTPGNKGGRPPSKLRAKLRRMAHAQLPTLGKIARGEHTKDADKIRAIDVMLKYGMDRQISVADLRHALRDMSELAYEMFEREQADAFLQACGPIFKQL